ncbi:peptidoglycan-binding protein [Rhizobiaceae bacterium n13]|uniref:Peptidoglycan-binding protein n=1 Tax=Ferirhizobium litorale TaxID=2927786 RepID=A0AAE3U0J6_9HYPH|nr:peptidoglycan-binding domain-containing protein [Fererhizobium litorale]MDI7861284.1 peptidoglycan-binding protein [Fererhizobium litorale]MDI7921431.1 peptidoglycan-binding protein [Fererhizobium litorale]
MTKRKRKAPERKAARRQPGLFYRGVCACGALVARHPSVAGGCAAFAVIFTFISANALWYQPGSHPSPIFRTRDADHPNALAGYRRQAEIDPAKVTTFRIERPEEAESEDAAAAAAEVPHASQLVMGVQQELSRRGLYTGAADGVMGPRTSAAILAFEAKAGMEQTGEASGELLAALQSETTAGTAVPRDRPVEDVPSVDAVDPIAAAIRAAEKGAPAQVALKGISSATNAELVMKIQQGLSNIAYANVSIDGVAGSQTRAAIRHFEKHYRLPETGEPNERVLKKLQQIGAL